MDFGVFVPPTNTTFGSDGHRYRTFPKVDRPVRMSVTFACVACFAGAVRSARLSDESMSYFSKALKSKFKECKIKPHCSGVAGYARGLCGEVD